MDTWLPYADYAAQRNHTVVGEVLVLPQLASPQLGNSRDILVYLPPSYRTSTQHYPVVYMHDGQNLFDAYTSYAGEWRVDETCENLADEGIELIVVGMPNTGIQRMAEYGPFRSRGGDGGAGDAYLQFVIETVKPLIDATFRTLPEREHTAIIGSSMGGLISLYAGFRFPATFGIIGAMSPSLWFANTAIFPFIRRTAFQPLRIYLDVGTREGGRSPVDRLLLHASSRSYFGNVHRMHELLVAKGYRPGDTLHYVEEPMAAHNEAAWARRLPDALRFLFQPYGIATGAALKTQS
jgi:predicted alpha/beta superfamily hydrolase